MLASKTIHELHDGLLKKEFSSREIVESVAGRIEKEESRISAYLSYDIEAALKKADEVDVKIHKGEDISPVAGIPFAVKDNICTEGVSTTCASKILENFIPPYDATIIKKLKAADFIMIGKTNMDEFAMGSSTENSSRKITRNPWDTERVPGGSSGGSAAAVAADMCIAALGSDTGGSIRQPASFCGVVGYKPTYGRVSRYGLVAFASSLDQIGPLAKDVQDAAILSSVIMGFDDMDSTSLNMPLPDLRLSADLKGMKIGIPKECFNVGIAPEVESLIKKAISRLSDMGAETVEISLPHNTEYAVATYYILATAEASSNLARYDGIKYGLRVNDSKDLVESYFNTRSKGFGAEVKRRIMLGTYVLSAGYYDAYYLKAQQVRRLIKEEMDKKFQEIDIILTPTAPTTAFKIGEKTDDPLSMYLSDIFTISANLAGNPAISVPCGLAADGLPVGVQFIGKAFDEAKVINTANALEKSLGRIHPGRKPGEPDGI